MTTGLPPQHFQSLLSRYEPLFYLFLSHKPTYARITVEGGTTGAFRVAITQAFANLVSYREGQTHPLQSTHDISVGSLAEWRARHSIISYLSQRCPSGVVIVRPSDDSLPTPPLDLVYDSYRNQIISLTKGSDDWSNQTLTLPLPAAYAAPRSTAADITQEYDIQDYLAWARIKQSAHYPYKVYFTNPPTLAQTPELGSTFPNVLVIEDDENKTIVMI